MATPRGLGRGLGALIPTKSNAAQVSRKKYTSPKTGTAVASDGAIRIPLDQIHPNPHQPRQHFAHGDLDDLIRSVKTHGILQPLVVSRRPDGEYELIAGERRLRASQMAGLMDVPVVIRSLNEQDKLVLALVENIQRADLNPMEEARAFQKLIDDFDFTQEAVAQQMGKSRSQIANTVRLLDLPEKIQIAVREGQIPVSSARALIAIDDPKEQLRWWKKMLKEHMTVRDVEAAVRKVKGVTSQKDANILAAEEQLRDILDTKVQIHKRGATGQLRISFYSDDELSKLVERLSTL